MMERRHSGEEPWPSELRELHAELSAFRCEERPSFGPELRAELARVWADEGGRRPTPWRRHLAAAVVAALLVGGAAVPGARASIVRFIGSIARPAVEVETRTTAEAVPVATDGIVEGRSSRVEAAEPEPSTLSGVVSEAPPAASSNEPVMVAPEMLGRVATEELLRSVYPLALQRRGVGGTVWLRLWVDDEGRPADAGVSRSSGVDELDRAALNAAPGFLFTPALHDGRPVATWIEFPVLFAPDPTELEEWGRILQPLVDPLSLPAIPRSDWWQLREPLDLDALSDVEGVSAADATGRDRAAALVDAALARTDVVQRYGPAASILRGEAPGRIAPTEWREAVSGALIEAGELGMENPASLLAFGRIRIRQGLRGEARSLFERGLQMTLHDTARTDPWLVAELHFERGSLLRDRWLGNREVGRVRSEAFAGTSCPAARLSGGAETGFASVERLLAWNYLCPGEMASVFGRGYEPANSGSAGDLSLMMASLHAAVEAYPAHVGANTDLLVTLAMDQRWEDVLSGARRFTRVSGGHPDGLLLAGLALQRTGRSAEAVEHFEAALQRMSDTDAADLTDLRVLLGSAERAVYVRLAPDERAAWEAEYWRTRGRGVSEAGDARWVEHLARAAFARLRFGTPFGDAGEVWVRFGRPDNVHIVDDGSGRLTEFWDYGSGPDITFVRWVSSKRTELTPEGRAYVDDLGKIFPPQ